MEVGLFFRNTNACISLPIDRDSSTSQRADASRSDGLNRSSYEVSVMEMERRVQLFQMF
jgi:hypothetical protein